MMILLYGVLAVVWVVTMILACWLMLNWDPNTAAMPRWKKCATRICRLAVALYSLPLLVISFSVRQLVTLVLDGICYVLRRFEHATLNRVPR